MRRPSSSGEGAKGVRTRQKQDARKEGRGTGGIGPSSLLHLVQVLLLKPPVATAMSRPRAALSGVPVPLVLFLLWDGFRFTTCTSDGWTALGTPWRRRAPSTLWGRR